MDEKNVTKSCNPDNTELYFLFIFTWIVFPFYTNTILSFTLKNTAMKNQIQYINPEGLFKSPAFSQVATTEGNGKTIYIGGQNAVNSKAELIGKGDLSAQTEQVMKNIEIALESAGATFSNLVKLNINLLQGQDAMQGFAAAQKFLSKSPTPPVVTVLFVAALGKPEYLLEIEAIAFVGTN